MLPGFLLTALMHKTVNGTSVDSHAVQDRAWLTATCLLGAHVVGRNSGQVPTDKFPNMSLHYLTESV